MAPNANITWGTVSRQDIMNGTYVYQPGDLFPWDNANENAAHKWKDLDCEGLPFLF